MPSVRPGHLGAMRIRRFHPGEEYELRQVFMSSVHTLAYKSYSQQQLNAWAPAAFGKDCWQQRIAAMNPFVAVVRGRIAAYAGLLETGCIDHFYVRGEFGGLGVGSALMHHLLGAAAGLGLARLHADVSLAAEAFFLRSGFQVEQRQTVVVQGVCLENVRMGKNLAAHGEGRKASRPRTTRAAACRDSAAACSDAPPAGLRHATEP